MNQRQANCEAYKRAARVLETAIQADEDGLAYTAYGEADMERIARGLRTVLEGLSKRAGLS